MPAEPAPVPAFRDVAGRHARCAWLDGGGAREWSGRRSILAWLDDDDVSLTFDAAAGAMTRHAAGRSVVVGDDPFVALQAELAAGPPDAHWFGYFGYAARPDLPARPDSAPGGARLPDAVWMRAGHVRFFDHPRPAADDPGGPGARTSYASRDPSRRAHDAAGGGGGRPADDAVGGGGEGTPAWYADAFARVQEELNAGNSYEVNLTHRTTVAAAPDPVSTYLRLRALNPAPYAGFLQHDVPGARGWLLSSSPERYALVTRDRRLETKPIKGTTPRGGTAGEDERLRAHLAGDRKYRAENLMIVDLLRNDLGTVCRPGTVRVPALMQVETYATVHQLVSTVTGDLADGVSTVGALRALFPAGSMTGAPKLRTMRIIEEVESSPRGAYAGAFGWVSADGRADLGVVIRSLVTAGDGRWTLGTGGGVTVRSDADEEYAETRWKAERLLAALGHG